MLTTSVDTSGLDHMIDGVKDALIGTGGDITNLAKDESRLLAMQLMKLSQPRSRSELKKKIAENVSRRFVLLDQDHSDFLSDQRYRHVSDGGIEWYRASSKFLFGVDDAKDMRHASGDEVSDVFYSSKIMAGRNTTQARIISDFKTPRKQQRVAILQQVVTSKSSLNRGIRAVSNSIGKLAASWFATAKTIDGSSKAPEWISKHIKGTKTTKSVTELGGLNNIENPSVTFGSHAHAVATKRGIKMVEFALKVRTTKLAQRLKLILSGYSEDVRHGIKVHRHFKKGSE